MKVIKMINQNRSAFLYPNVKITVKKATKYRTYYNFWNKEIVLSFKSKWGKEILLENPINIMSEILTHEYLHHILAHFISFRTCSDLDNIQKWFYTDKKDDKKQKLGFAKNRRKHKPFCFLIPENRSEK